MNRLLAVGAATAVVALAAACAATRDDGDVALRVDDAPAPWRPPPKQVPAPSPPPSVPARGQTPGLSPDLSGRINALVTVIDGDTNRRIHGARVVIGKRFGYANPRGLAYVRVNRPAPLEVRVSKPGYGTRTVRLPLQRNRRGTVRLYRTATQWPMFGANPQRTNAHTGIKLRPPFRTVWSRGVGSLVEFPAVVHEGVAFVANYHGHVWALRMRDGAVVWRFRPSGSKMASSPAVVGEDVVIHGMDGLVRVLNRRNGKLRWSYRVGSPIESSPVVVNGVDYFGAWNGRIFALDLQRRTLRWSFRTGHKITSSAALHKDTLYIGDYGGRVHALAQRNGKRRWVASVGGRIYGTPAVDGKRVYVPSSTGGTLTAFSTGGRRLWRVSTGAYVYSSPAVWAGRVFFGSYNGRLYSVAAGTGRVLWTVPAGRVSGAAVVVDGIVYAGSTYGSITAADAKTGKVVLRFPHGEYVPVSGNGSRLLLHGYSRLWAVEPVRKAKG